MAQPAVVLPVAAGAEHELIGMATLAAKAGLPPGAKTALEAELLSLGAVHVQELTPEDWTGLVSWAHLRPFEQRRLLASLA